MSPELAIALALAANPAPAPALGPFDGARQVRIEIPRMTTRTVAVHTHRCPFDGTTWTHTEASFGNRAEHTCPQCHRVIFGNIVSRGTQTIAVPSLASIAAPHPQSGGWTTPNRVTYESCPTGH